ncbi:NMT1/THI5 like family protein (plasmid) [Ochrobactrum quorumnocens]|uniref:NMT1/THI5 like family protein n=1 Tax=Ochrobactrum quorumnocens TaxID=271865 RepID=A0A248UNT0_9HYPH|nr:ABC transporter substrate-binding protein [[Ochrobactrum] quorumnocens]ASV88051.1 NMT1/THI5 like family protein [[Ochrobactrum] quorumnocens]
MGHFKAGLVASVALFFAGQAAAGTITIAVPNPSAVLLLPIVAAMGEGYFAEEGIEVNIEALNGSGAVLQALASGQAQIGNPGAGPFLQARTRGLDVKLIYRLNPLSSFSLVVPEGSDVTSAAALKGKVIGVGTADGSETAFARSILKEAGLEEGKDYSFLVVGDGGQATAGFLRKDIDAYAAATSDAAILNARGVKLFNITPEKYKTFFGNSLAAMQPWLNENQSEVEGFGRAMVRGAKWAADPANREKLIAHIGEENPQEIEDRAFANALIDQIIIRQTPFDIEKGYGYQDHAAWEAWQNSLIGSGDLKEPLHDLNAVYTNQYINTWNGK